MRTYPTSTANPNVPPESYLLAETSSMSGEIVTTYYADRNGYLFMVCDWKGERSRPVSLHRVTELTGDTEQMVTARIESHFRLKGKD